MLDPSERGRECYRRQQWADAYQAFLLADRSTPLGVDDLERLGTCAFLIGRDPEHLQALERAHHAHLESGQRSRAARCAFWIGLRLLLRGELGPATGWLGRAKRLLDDEGVECVEHGYLLLPVAEQHLEAGDAGAAHAAGTCAAGIGARFGDADLRACAWHLQGRALLQQRRIGEGLALLDEAMVAVTAGELSPVMTGLIYCSVIDSCQRFFALSRAREWTSALGRWCAGQPQLVAFTGKCLIHRAQILQLHGAWPDALDEAQRACERYAAGADQRPPAAAYYQQGEVHRLRGEYELAEAAYRDASRWGWEPQPGLALLRLAQGRRDAACAAIRRVVGNATDHSQRAKLLAAQVEIMLAAGELGEARSACRELQAIAEDLDAAALDAMAAHAAAAVRIADGDARAGLPLLRRALQVWQQVEAPYEAARVRLLLAVACRDVGDDDGAAFELDAARASFEQLGALPDLARVESLTARRPARSASGLTPRELQVLRLIAFGKTNKAIAAQLALSEKTVDRHVSNIFNKLNVATRAAATGYAYEHKLI